MFYSAHIKILNILLGVLYTLHFLLFHHIICIDNSRVTSPTYVRIGQDINLECNSSKESKWLYMSNTLPRNAKTFKDNSLVIYSANENNGGHYECEGTDETMKTFYAETKLDIFSEFIK